MSEILRITPERARERQRHHEALLVCAHDDEKVCERMLVEGGITLEDLRRIEDGLDPDRELIFYCDTPGDSLAAARAEKWAGRDFSDVQVLRGGVAAWQRAGLPMSTAPRRRSPSEPPSEQDLARRQPTGTVDSKGRHPGPPYDASHATHREQPDNELEGVPEFDDLTGRRPSGHGMHEVPEPEDHRPDR